jgi:lysozyme
MKKLILYITSVIAAVALLIYVVNFAVKILKTVPNNHGEAGTNQHVSKQDIEDGHEQSDHPDVSRNNSPGGDEISSRTDYEEEVPIPEPVDDIQDPQEEGTEGAVLDVRDIDKNENETDDITYGIDVAKWQGVIDWAKVKEAGVDFAMIRIGYRTLVSGEITEDPYAKYNLQQAGKHGIMLGVYFFSSAINEEEALEEAKWVAEFIAPYKITYPVAYNCEGFSDPDNRQFNLTKEERSNLAVVFLDYIKEKGYVPMFYASQNELDNSSEWDTDSLTKKYKIWVAQYPDYMVHGSKSSYLGAHDMWQYTNNGRVPGITGSVDLNIAYFGYTKAADAKDDTPVKEVSADPLALITFKEVNEIVTAKEVTNLRDIPGTDTGSKVIEVLYYGDTAVRTGIGDNGWSRVEYKGKTLYAVTSYLTTNLNYKDNILKPTLEDPEAGIDFTEVNQKVTAKIITNLRLVPSTESDETIVTSLEHGQVAVRTGIGSNGWSRVEYEGQTLYAVTNYLELVEDE